MIDPISAVAIATATFNGINKMISAGREVEDVVGQVGKWYAAVSDFNAGKQDKLNPPLFKKIINSKSVEQEAIDMFIAEKKIKDQERQLRELLIYAYGTGAYEELIELRRKIRKQREDSLYKQARRRKNFLHTSITILLVILILGILCATAYALFLLF